jgi:Right handed beta helix region
VKTQNFKWLAFRTASLCALVLVVVGAFAYSAVAAQDPSLKVAKTLASLEKKLAKTQAKHDDIVLNISAKQSAVDSAVLALANAQAMPATDSAAVKAKIKAVAKAQKKVTAANKKLAVQQSKLVKNQTTLASYVGEILKLDPDHFDERESAPVLVAEAQPGAVVFTWDDVSGANSYVIAWSFSPGVDPATATLITGATSPNVLEGIPGGSTVYAVAWAVTDGDNGPIGNEVNVSALPLPEPPPVLSPYDPSWGTIAPLHTIQLVHDAGLSNAANGLALAAAVNALQPGDRLVIGAGTWQLDQPLNVTVSGTALAPITIEAAQGETPLLLRNDLTDGLLRVGGAGLDPSVSYLTFRGLEATGGDVAIRLRKCSNIWIDLNHLHNTGAGVYAVDENTSHLYITRNHIHDTLLYGEGVQFGKDYPNFITHDSIVALNYIHDTKAAIQGDGIDMKWRCYRNWIVRNVVQHTRYPCIIFEGTQLQPVNVIENNICWDSGDNVMQAQGGEATVRNNLLLSPAGNKLFDSTHSSADLRNLVVTHNTMFGATTRGAGLFGWNGQENMVFANNVIMMKQTTGNSYALALTPGSLGGTLSGNVIFGDAHDVPSGYKIGNGPKDFAGVPTLGYVFTGDVSVFEPAANGTLVGAGDVAFEDAVDLLDLPRVGTLESGCLDLH